MINFNFETILHLEEEKRLKEWIAEAVAAEGFLVGEINYVFCTDEYLHKINLQYLNHDTYTDIISFDYRVGKQLHGDIFISVDRVKENATKFEVDFNSELLRVLIHGILHFCGYKDKLDNEVNAMRAKEDYYVARY
ncbi:rRNA maturation RNase YbeY [Winogradskyella sp. KYW1333]|uniref:rRNA maturation RNase YbeY n=1 Tax=Winogradskyella sp. KYW1333 TaxID=2282123 RepID=UPI000DF2CB30|nr:rRNA maturation RNase YbeY [Winogradskyella sp. KYW1333]RCT53629.1 rRNA maturation RNase YbeY [Winogradskyella sp. KYW1333]